VLLTERANHVNTPAAGTAELWVDNTDPGSVQIPRITDDAGDDKALLLFQQGTLGTLYRIPYCSDTGTGEVKTDGNLVYVDGNDELRLEGNANLALGESASAPTAVAGRGYFWVKNDAPNIPMFTDDDGTDIQIGRSYITQYVGMAVGGATVSEWYGPHTSSIYATGTAAFSRGNGTHPTVWYYSVNPPMPADATVRDIEMWNRSSPSTTDGDLRMYKCAFVDGTGGTTLTQIGSDFVVNGTNTNRYDHSQVGIDASISKGDTLELFWRHRTTGTVWVSCNVLLELD